MTTETIKLQVTIPRELALALRVAATKDRRSRPTFIVKLLEESSLVKDALVSVRSTTSSSAPPVTPSAPPVAPSAPPVVNKWGLPPGLTADDLGANDPPPARS